MSVTGLLLFLYLIGNVQVGDESPYIHFKVVECSLAKCLLLANNIAFEFRTNLKMKISTRFSYPGVFSFLLVFINSCSH